MQKVLILFLLFGVAVVVGVVFLGRDAVPSYTNYPPKNETIVAFGDSLVAGVGATEGNDFPSQLSRLIGRDVLNLGESGNTTRDGVRRLQSVVDEEPGIVILLLGGNDYLRRIPSTETFSNLAQIIDVLHTEGVLVVMLGVRGGVLSDAYADEYEKLAREKNVAFVPNVLDDLLGERALMADSIHPNDEGYAIIAKRVAEVVREVLPQ